MYSNITTITARRTISLRLAPTPDALRRLVTVCGRRRLDIVALVFSRAGEHEAAGVELTVEGTPGQLAGAEAWLGHLVDVLHLEAATRRAATG